MKKRFYSIVSGLVYFGLLVFFSYLSLQSGEKSAESSTTVGNIIADTGEKIFNVSIERTPDFFRITRKIVGHFGYFVLLGVSSWAFYRSFGNLPFWIRAALHYGAGLFFAFVSEFVFQRISSGRSSSFVDVLIDFAGFILLSTFIIAVEYVRRRKRDGQTVTD